MLKPEGTCRSCKIGESEGSVTISLEKYNYFKDMEKSIKENRKFAWFYYHEDFGNKRRVERCAFYDENEGNMILSGGLQTMNQKNFDLEQELFSFKKMNLFQFLMYKIKNRNEFKVK